MGISISFILFSRSVSVSEELKRKKQSMTQESNSKIPNKQNLLNLLRECLQEIKSFNLS